MRSAPELLSDTVFRLRSAGCVFAEDEARLFLDAAADSGELASLVDRRVAGEPLEVILGWADFAGVRVVVESGVFVPRQRTVFLVEQAVAVCPAGGVVVDLCCGSGAIGLAMATRIRDVQVFACDVDPVAVRCATTNLAAVDGHVRCGDLFAPLPDRLRGSIDVVAVNAPYVPTEEIAFMPTEARDHEPQHTLDGGADGVGIHRRVAAGVGEWLRPGGHVLIETSEAQADLTAAALTAAGLTTRCLYDDGRGATVVIARRPV